MRWLSWQELFTFLWKPQHGGVTVDQKTNILVLKTILELSPDRHLKYPIVAVHNKLPDLSEEIIEGAIKDSEKAGRFRILRGDDTIGDIQILPEAIGHLRELEEIQNRERLKRYQTWGWDLVKILLGAIAGYLIKSFT